MEGRPQDARRILGGARGRGWFRDRALLLRALIAGGARREARELLPELRELAEGAHDSAALCELAAAVSGLSLHDGPDAATLSLVDDHLAIAADCGLGLHWIDLLTVRSGILLALGRAEEAARSAAAALAGPGSAPDLVERWPAAADLLGASHPDCGDRAGALAAIDALRAAGAEVDQSVVDRVAAAPTPVEQPFPPRRREPPAASSGVLERRRHLHEEALRVVEEYGRSGTPFVLYFRTFGMTVLHGPAEYGPRLLENALRDAVPDGVNVLTIQSHGPSEVSYAGRNSPIERSAPSLLLEDDRWRDIVRGLVPHADLIVSECLLLSEGVRFELETCYQARREDRTVLVLPPQAGWSGTVDNDPLVQLFPRCVWADMFHTEPFVGSPVVEDLIIRLGAIASLPEEKRRTLIGTAARDEAYPIDLLALAAHYETSAALGSQFSEEDERIRYDSFWELFRAVSIRGYALLDGDDSFHNRYRLADGYLQMGAVMLDHERDGDRVVFVGDLVFAEQCMTSADNLMREGDPQVLVDLVRHRADSQFNDLQRVRKAIEIHPDRVIARPRYGPFTVRPARPGAS